MDRRHFLAGAGATATAFAAEPMWAKGLARNADRALLTLLDAIFQDGITHSPEFATSLGLDKGRLAPLRGLLSPPTAAERHRDLARARRWQARLGAIRPALLSATGQRYQARVKYMLEQRTLAAGKYDIDAVQTPYRLYQQGGAYFNIPDFLNSAHPINTAADAEAYLARLSAFAVVLDQDTAGQRAEAARGLLAPGWSIDLTLGQMHKLRDVAAADNTMVRSIATRTKVRRLPETGQPAPPGLSSWRCTPRLTGRSR